MSMFYSHLLLSKKGPFGTIWVAAHCHKKLKKDQITHTNISASVDKILKDGVPTVTCRILAFLLLGVVRIYSKKVEYLFHDCRDVLTEILRFASSKHTSTNLGGMCTSQPTHKRRAAHHVETICVPYSTITLPEKFELDSFDLELLEDARGDHVKPRNEIMLQDSWEDGRSGCHSLDKDQFGKDTGLFEDFSEAFFPPREFVPDPKPDSVEKFRDNGFSLEERLDPMILGEGEQESDFRRSFDQELETGGDHVKASIPEMMVEERAEPSGLNSSFYDLQHTEGETEVMSKMNSVGTEKLQVTPEHHAVSITLDGTPKPKLPNVLGTTSNAGATTPELMAVRTPAPKERPRLSRKRRCIIDEEIVVPNIILKGWINDWSDLVCKRRKVPRTTMHVWKAHQVMNLPQSFLAPLIPIDFKLLTSNKNLETQEAVKPMASPAKSDGLKPIEIIETSAIADGCGSPGTHGFPEEEAIAPSTPVTHSTSARFNEIRPTSKSHEVEPASSSEWIEREFSPTDDRDLDEVLMNEELDPYQGDSQEIYKWSTRTRIVARHLHKNLVRRAKRGKEETKEALRFSQVLKGKSKKESARLFYELLVLKTGGYVDVKQEKAYDDILVLECSKLKKACEAVGY